MLQLKLYEGKFTKVTKLSPYRGQNGKHRNKLYQDMLKLAGDSTSELYFVDKLSGFVYERRGAAHRNAFWAGYDEAMTGVKNKLAKGEKTSDTEVCYRAGLDFGKAELKAMCKAFEAAITYPKVIAEVDTRAMVISVTNGVYAVTVEGKVVQPNQTAEGVIRYLAHMLQGADYDIDSLQRQLTS